jgi:hypothetical protein
MLGKTKKKLLKYSLAECAYLSQPLILPRIQVEKQILNLNPQILIAQINMKFFPNYI